MRASNCRRGKALTETEENSEAVASETG